MGYFVTFRGSPIF